jgi:hypothetical protein
VTVALSSNNLAPRRRDTLFKVIIFQQSYQLLLGNKKRLSHLYFIYLKISKPQETSNETYLCD